MTPNPNADPRYPLFGPPRGLASPGRAGLHRATVAAWLGTELLSPDGRLRGRVAAVGRCRHAGLCDGVRLTVAWADGIETCECSAECDRLAADLYRLGRPPAAVVR